MYSFYCIKFVKYKKLKSKIPVFTIQMLHLYDLQKMVFHNLSDSNSDMCPASPTFDKMMVNTVPF